MTKTARRFLLALVRGEVCGRCNSAPAVWFYMGPECGPCCVKRVDREEAANGGPL